jgi:rhamnosyltransferase
MVNVGVLLATYNGEPWIRDQIDSVLAQKMVSVVIYVSDDFSTDGSYKYFKQLAQQDKRVILLDKTEKFGSAGKNFYRLICDVETDGLDYLAFCDQDDIWHDKKLIHHVNLARQNQADGVSSNVTAF